MSGQISPEQSLFISVMIFIVFVSFVAITVGIYKGFTSALSSRKKKRFLRMVEKKKGVEVVTFDKNGVPVLISRKNGPDLRYDFV